ncbi:MAG TPA: hypothetical protein VGJ00_00875, partial [Rhabdochlamydiaceae bacterium]
MTSSSSIHACPKSRPDSLLDLLPEKPEPVSQTEPLQVAGITEPLQVAKITEILSSTLLSSSSSSSSSSFSSSMISSLSGEAPTGRNFDTLTKVLFGKCIAFTGSP